MRRRLWLGGMLVGVAAAAALVSLLWTPWDVTLLDIAHRLAPPSWRHPLGTDRLGRDLLSMLMAGAAPSLGTALLAVAIGLGAGVPLGLLAAARPGLVDEGVARLADILFAFPALVLALLIVAVLGPGASRAALAIGLFAVPVFARVTRAAARTVWTRDFILAARLAGKGTARITIDHVLPNIAGALIAQGAVQLSLALLAEAGLAFLGLGAQPPQPSWGRMVADAQTLIGVAPRLALLPGLAIMLTVLGVTLLADALHDGLERDAA